MHIPKSAILCVICSWATFETEKKESCYASYRRLGRSRKPLKAAMHTNNYNTNQQWCVVLCFAMLQVGKLLAAIAAACGRYAMVE